MSIDSLKNCPECGANWDNGDIFDVLQKKHLNEPIEKVKEWASHYGWSEDNKVHFSKVIGLEIPGKYDGVSYWKCPECQMLWDRFTEKKVGKYDSVLLS